MKFLVHAKSRIGGAAARPQNPLDLLQAAKEWNLARLADGTFESVYGFAAGRGGVAIVNVESHAQLMKLLLSSPMFHYVDYEVQPLCDVGEYWDIHRGALPRSAAT
jgi:muconolactone delta-isomerase